MEGGDDNCIYLLTENSQTRKLYQGMLKEFYGAKEGRKHVPNIVDLNQYI